jgi:hypothetical protein
MADTIGRERLHELHRALAELDEALGADPRPPR